MNVRDRILISHRHACAVCGEGFPIQVHHIIPREKGGKDEYENLIVLCTKHHELAHIKTRTSRKLTVSQLREYRKDRINQCKDKPYNYEKIKLFIPKNYKDGKDVGREIMAEFTVIFCNFFGGVSVLFETDVLSSLGSYHPDKFLKDQFTIQVIVSKDLLEKSINFIKKHVNEIDIKFRTHIYLTHEDFNIITF